MPIKTNTRLLRAMREIIMGNAKSALPYRHEPKPDFTAEPLPVPLPRSTPESEGLHSRQIAELLSTVAAVPDTNPHSLLVGRHGKMVAEVYFEPYRKNVWHVLHSTCKSFTGAATGLAISEGLFKLDDTVAQYFPRKTALAPKKHKSITVRHLLTMSSGITLNEVNELVEPDWVGGVFTRELAFEPGSRFMYNSMNSYLLAALIRETSGQSLMEFLMPRLFAPMGFGPVGWEKSLAGVEKGGWGMYLTPEDMAKFGQLYLQKGKWCVDGKMKQLVPAGWVKQSSSVQITGENGEEYGFHMWANSKTRGFTMNGMFGQYIAGFPKQDMLVVMTAGNPNISPRSGAFDVIQTFMAGIEAQDALPKDSIALRALRKTIATLQKSRSLVCAKPAFAPAIKPAVAKEKLAAFCGITWKFEPSYATILPVVTQCINNNFCGGIKALQLQMDGDDLLLYWEEDEGTQCIPVGLTAPKERLLQLGHENFLIAAEGALRFNEDDEAVLKIRLSYLEHSSCRTLKLLQRDGKLLLRMDEAPQLSIALQTAVVHNAATTGASENDPLTRLLKNNRYLNYQITQLCEPEVWGAPLE